MLLIRLLHYGIVDSYFWNQFGSLAACIAVDLYSPEPTVALLSILMSSDIDFGVSISEFRHQGVYYILLLVFQCIVSLP